MLEPSLAVDLEPTKKLPRVERRAWKRYPCPRRPIIRVLTRPSFVVREATVLDVSRGGIGLLMAERLEPGTVLALQLQAKHTGQSRILSARVVYANQQPDGSWRVGCALGALFSEEELESLLWDGP
jgi:hypothetical protein